MKEIQNELWPFSKLIKKRGHQLRDGISKMNYSSSVGLGNNCNSSLVPQTILRRYDFSSELTRNFLIAAAVLSFVACPLTCFFNGLVILAVKVKRRLQTHSNIMLACFALTNVLNGVLVQPLNATLAIFLLQGKDFHEVCEVNLAFSFSFMEVSLISMSHLILISGERYLTIKYSLRHNEVLTNTSVIVSSFLTWITAVILYFILPNTMMTFAILEITVFSSIVILQVLVYKQARRHEKSILTHQVSMEAKAKFKREKKALKSTTLLIVIVTLFFLVPFTFLNFTWYIFEKRFSDEVKMSARQFCLGIVTLNSVVNPIIYTVRNRHFRVAFIEMLLGKTPQEAEENERKLFRFRQRVMAVRLEARQERKVNKGCNEIQPDDARDSEEITSGEQISINTRTVPADDHTR